MTSEQEVLKVYPEFKRNIKIAAADKGMTILDYTRHLSQINNPISNMISEFEKRKQKPKIDFP